MAASYYYTASTGSAITFPDSTPANTRCGIIIAQGFSTSVGTRQLTSLTWGALELVGSGRAIVGVRSTAAQYVYQEFYFVSEADIAAYNGGTVTATWSGSLTDVRIRVVGFQDAAGFSVSQSTGIYIVDQNAVQSVSDTVSVPSGGVVLASLGTDYNVALTDITWTGATERADANNGTVWRRSFATVDATSGDVTITADWSASGATEEALLVILVVAPAATTKKLKLLVGPDAASASDIEVAVHSAPSGTDYVTGTTRYGSASGQTFEASLESGQAVLKVLASSVGCDALEVGTTVAAVARNGTYTSGVVSATIIEE